VFNAKTGKKQLSSLRMNPLVAEELVVSVLEQKPYLAPYIKEIFFVSIGFPPRCSE